MLAAGQSELLHSSGNVHGADTGRLRETRHLANSSARPLSLRRRRRRRRRRRPRRPARSQSRLAVPAAHRALASGCSATASIHAALPRPLPACRPPPPSLPLTAATTASRSSPAPAASPASPLPPARWSLTNRLFNFALPSLYPAHPPPSRPPASRLWNPVNSSPRSPRLSPPLPRPDFPNLPVEHARPGTHDEHPLLTLPQQHQHQQSPALTSTPTGQRFTSEDCIAGRTSIGLPRHRISLHVDSRSPTPGPAMAVQQQQPASTHGHASTGAQRAGDLELGAELSKRSPVRASIPASGATSMHSGMGSAQGDGDDDDDDDDASEFPWGPSHPCFPHPNPHVPLTSELHDTTRIIRIKRDWMTKGDLAPTFANLYPEILDPLVTEDDFRALIKKINDTLIDAFDPFTFRAWLDAVMGVATFWLWDDVGLTGVKQKLTDLERWIEDWNRDVGAQEGVKIISLRRTGYLTLDIQIPDPHLGPESGSSRPSTQPEESNAMPPQIDYLPYPITPTLQVNSLPTPIKSHS